MSTRPFNDTEIIEAVGIKLKQMRDDTREATDKLRDDLRKEFKAELEAEVLKLRNEFLQDRLDQERGKKLKVVPPPSPGAMIA